MDESWELRNARDLMGSVTQFKALDLEKKAEPKKQPFQDPSSKVGLGALGGSWFSRLPAQCSQYFSMLP